MKNNFCIGIATYQRADSQRTLDFLERIRFPKDKIILSVQTLDELKSYKKNGVSERVGTLIYKEANSAAGNRNTILESVPVGRRIVLMDDDIKTIMRKVNGILKPVETLTEFHELIDRGFCLARLNNTICWGVYPVDNAYFMKESYTKKNIFTTQLMGLVNSEMRFNSVLQTKEDYEFCCRIIRKYGACVRLNDYAVHAPKQKGGCETAWNDKEAACDVADLLCMKYPDILVKNTKRKGEVLMRRSCKK